MVRDDCRHYSSRSTPAGDVLQRCRLDAAEPMPFACPEGCLFFEPRKLSDTGWLRLDRPGDPGGDTGTGGEGGVGGAGGEGEP